MGGIRERDCTSRVGFAVLNTRDILLDYVSLHKSQDSAEQALKSQAAKIRVCLLYFSEDPIGLSDPLSVRLTERKKRTSTFLIYCEIFRPTNLYFLKSRIEELSIGAFFSKIR